MLKDIIYQNKELLPQHVAIIMDGNGRWAKKNKLKVALGHRSGVESLHNIIEETNRLGIASLTLYAFSTENWKRSKSEVAALMQLILDFFDNDIKRLHEKNVKVVIIGDVDSMPDAQRDVLKAGMELTSKNTGMLLNIAINYGGRAELVRACKLIAKDVLDGNMSIDDIDEQAFADRLYMKDDIDLMIRTSGEMRLSNFLLYQNAYAEFVFPTTLWPDYTVEEYYKSLYEYMQRDRRFGGRVDG